MRKKNSSPRGGGKRPRVRLVLLIAALITLLLHVDARAVPEGSTHRIRVGVLAKRGHDRCLTQWGPTADYLSEQIPGYRFEILPLGFNEITPAVERDEVDFILANPAFYVDLEQRYGASAIATLENLRLDGSYTVFGGVVFWMGGWGQTLFFVDKGGRRR